MFHFDKELYFKNVKINTLKTTKDKVNGISGVNAKDINTINYFLNKKIKFVINPFDDKKRYFDFNTINVMKQNNIYGLVLFSELKKLNKIQQTYFLRNAKIFADLCKKKKVFVYFASGLNKDETTERQEKAWYCLFGFSKDQADVFYKVLEEELK